MQPQQAPTTGNDQRIIPHLWFDKEAKEAAAFYTKIFPQSKLRGTTTIPNTPSGSVDIVSFELLGQPFMAISAGPFFTFNPSISFLVLCKTVKEVETLWETLSEGGTALMELGAYPFSEKYGWLQDKFGVSWQIMLYADGNQGKEITQKIIPSLLFTGNVCGKAEEAIHFYKSIFKNSATEHILRYEKGEEPDKEGTVKHAAFTLLGQQFAAMDSAYAHKFGFNEAISFMVHCKTQEEIDYYWDRLTEGGDPQAQQCGWLKDKFGISWQVVPTIMEEMLASNNAEKIARLTEAFLKMKKFDIAALESAYQGA